MEKREIICPRCGLEREAAIRNLANGDSSMALLMAGCLYCAEVLEAWKKYRKGGGKVKKVESRQILETTYYCDVCHIEAGWHSDSMNKDFCWPCACKAYGSEAEADHWLTEIEKEIKSGI